MTSMPQYRIMPLRQAWLVSSNKKRLVQNGLKIKMVLSTYDRKLVAIIYLCWAIPLLVLVAVVTPPWQSPDEPAHMMRADQVIHGQVVGRRIGPLMAGGVSDPHILDSFNSLAQIPFHADEKLTRAMLQSARSYAWGPRSFVLNPNTAQYPPFFYVAPGVAVRLGQVLGFSIVNTLYLARLTCAVLTALLTALAFTIARRTLGFLMIVAMLPMNVSLSASLSQDGQMLSCIFLAVALLDRLITEGREASRSEAAAIIVLLAFVGMARPPYIPLSLLSLLITRKTTRRGLTSAGIIALIILLWAAISALFVTVPMAGSSAIGQLNFVTRQPIAAWFAFENTLTATWRELLFEAVGKLGWLDTNLAQPFYIVVVLLLAFGFSTAASGQSRRPAIAVVAVLLTCVFVMESEYFTWTRVGARTISGLQGRYFEVPLAVSSLCVPASKKMTTFAVPLGLLCVVVMGICGPLLTLSAIVMRFYLA